MFGMVPFTAFRVTVMMSTARDGVTVSVVSEGVARSSDPLAVYLEDNSARWTTGAGDPWPSLVASRGLLQTSTRHLAPIARPQASTQSHLPCTAPAPPVSTNHQIRMALVRPKAERLLEAIAPSLATQARRLGAGLDKLRWEAVALVGGARRIATLPRNNVDSASCLTNRERRLSTTPLHLPVAHPMLFVLPSARRSGDDADFPYQCRRAAPDRRSAEG